MTVYRRLARSKRGMSTIFGGLFFIILVLMGFNLMIWNFIQYDSYNRTVTSMTQLDQQAQSENLIVNQPGAVDFATGTFNITVTNVGISVMIARIYVNNYSPTGSTQCSTSSTISPCTVDTTSSTTSCVSGTSCYFTGGNVQVGELNHKIQIVGLRIDDGSGYKVILSTSRGRLFSFYYPWPVSPSGGGGGNTFFQTNVGPLSIYFDFKSFNFTYGSQTQSQSAFCLPSGTTILLWIKVTNQATDGDVKLEPNTIIEAHPYTANGFGKYVRTWIVDPGSVNPGNIVGYNFNTNPYVIPKAPVNGPGPAVEVKFGGSGAGSGGGVSFSQGDNWLTFIGFYYLYLGNPQGETIPFMDFKDVSGWPGTC